ncbi:MAG: acyl carrier protein [Planctomycetota bacterium]
MTSRESIRGEIAKFVKKPVSKIGDGVSLLDLVQESFVLVEMVIDLQETFSVRFGQEDLSAVKTVGDLIDLVERRVRA